MGEPEDPEVGGCVRRPRPTSCFETGLTEVGWSASTRVLGPSSLGLGLQACPFLFTCVLET